ACGQRVRGLPAFAQRDGARRNGAPTRLLTLEGEGRRPVPGPRRAGLAPRMGELDAGHGVVAPVEIGNALEAGYMCVRIDAGAAIGRAPIRRDAGRLDEGRTE